MAKLLFDENVPNRLVAALVAISRILDLGAEIQYLPDFTNRYAVPDTQWIPRLASEGWVVITADRAKRSHRRPLPRICQQFGVTHVLVGPSIHGLKQVPKLASLLSVWSDLIAATNDARGSRFLWSRAGEKSSVKRTSG